GHTDTFFYNGRRAIPPFAPADANANDYTSIIGAAQYAQRSFGAGEEEPVSEGFNTYTVYPRLAGTRSVFTSRGPRSVSLVDGVKTFADTEYEMAISGSARQQTGYATAPGVEGEVVRSTSIFAWEIPEYAEAFKQRHVLAAAVQSRTFRDNVQAAEPRARIE